MKPIFIPFNCPSSKNSKVWTGKTLISNKSTREYENNTYFIYKTLKTKFRKMINNRKYPLRIGFFFIRDSKRHFDYINVLQKVADMMVFWGWIDDDDMDHFIPVFLGYMVDRDNAGVEIFILDNQPQSPQKMLVDYLGQVGGKSV